MPRRLGSLLVIRIERFKIRSNSLHLNARRRQENILITYNLSVVAKHRHIGGVEPGHPSLVVGNSDYIREVERRQTSIGILLDIVFT
jgi:hypothetical protein